MQLQHHLLSIFTKSWQTWMYVRITLKFQEVLPGKIFMKTTLYLRRNLCHTHTYIQSFFSKIVKLYAGHPKTCNSIKNQQSKIFTRPVHSSIYTEESIGLVQIFDFRFFDGITRFGMSWTRFDYFWKMSVFLFMYASECLSVSA